MSFLPYLFIGIVLIIVGFYLIGRHGERKSAGIGSLVLGFVVCLGAIYPTYIAASILANKNQVEAQYLIDHMNSKQDADAAVKSARTALHYSKVCKNKKMIKANQELLNAAKKKQAQC